MDLEFYRDLVSVNVKFHGQPKLSKGYRRKLEKLGCEQELLSTAFEIVSRDYWSEVRSLACFLNLGEVGQLGRSGGHLVLHDVRLSRIEGLRHIASRECFNCHLPLDEHAGTKCIFDATHFETANKTAQGILDNVELFVEKAAIDHEKMVDTLTREMEALIDLKWEEQREQLRGDLPSQGRRADADHHVVSAERREAQVP